MVKVLLFDFGGTLDGPKHWLDRFLASYRDAGVDITREHLDPAFEHATQIGYRAGKVLERFGLPELVQFLVGHQVEYLQENGCGAIGVRLGGASAKDRYRLVEQITASFVDESRAGMARSRAIVESLKPRFRMGIVSNFYGNLDRIIAEAKMQRLFDTIIDSSRVGAFKPDPRIFREALDALSAQPAQAAMVGDSLAKDCAPAHAIGIATVWYRPPSQSTPVEAPSQGGTTVADHTIATLEEIAALDL
ncbi:MAG TPA: HAD family hydrolase [Candidatus Binataceae bacterium]|nr:HAD family hydrolase [Candidatus Binataceae bacterium]